jgi:hypothetical protein
MSRFTCRLNNGNIIAFGFDRPLQEYFFSEYDNQEELLFSIMTYNTTDPHPNHPDKLTYSNGELLEVMQEYLAEIVGEFGMDQLAHAIGAITFDLPY